MSSELVPRREALPEWMRETSALGELSRSVVVPMLAQELFRIPSDCTATIVAFPASTLVRKDVFAEIATDSDWTMFGALPELPTWARTVNASEGRVHLAGDERLAIFGAGDHLSSLLAAFGERVAFVTLGFDQVVAVAESLNQNAELVGLRVGGLDDSPEALEALVALELLDHVDWLAIGYLADYNAPQDASTVARLASIKALRHLELGFTNAADLEPLKGLTSLWSLTVWAGGTSGWRPQLPELRTLRVALNDGRSANPRLDCCPSLERLMVEWLGNADELLESVESMSRLRRLIVSTYMGVPWFSTAAVDRLARLVQLRELCVGNGGYLDVSGGHLRRLETLTALDSLRAAVVGAGDDDVAWLAERLPSTKLKLTRSDRVAHR